MFIYVRICLYKKDLNIEELNIRRTVTFKQYYKLSDKNIINRAALNQATQIII